MQDKEDSRSGPAVPPAFNEPRGFSNARRILLTRLGQTSARPFASGGCRDRLLGEGAGVRVRSVYPACVVTRGVGTREWRRSWVISWYDRESPCLRRLTNKGDRQDGDSREKRDYP